MPTTRGNKQKKKSGTSVAVSIAGDGVSASSMSASALPIGNDCNGLKDAGNAAFTAGEYRRALELYTRAIDLCSDDASLLTHLYSNRSATFASLNEFEKAIADAEATIALSPQWPKGHLRKGFAEEQMLKFGAAHATYTAAMSVASDVSSLDKALADLNRTLSLLKLTPSQLTSTLNPDTDRFDRLIQWLMKGGARFPKLYLQWYSDDYRGVHCLTRIPADEQILFVPHNMIMTSAVAMDSHIGRAIQASNIELRSKHSYLAAFLLVEKAKGAESYWHPYIDSLPQHYANMPLFFKEPLISHLTGSFTLAKIKDRIDSLKTEYDNLCAAVEEFRQFTHEQFVWARLVVITRIFGLFIRGHKTDGLVAYADMLNHKKATADQTDTDTKWTFDDNLNGFIITTLKPIQRGDQVFDSYGRKCNSRFFVNYGFTIDDNAEDNEVCMRFTLSASDPLYAVKARMLGSTSRGGIVREFQVPATYRETSDREKKTRDMFTFLRIAAANNEEIVALQSVKASADGRIDETEALSPRNEHVVLTLIRHSAVDVLSGFTHTLEEDDALLKTEQALADSNYRNCIVMRRGEKVVLHWYINCTEVGCSLLETPWRDARRVIAKKFTGTAPVDFYVQTVIAPLMKRFAA